MFAKCSQLVCLSLLIILIQNVNCANILCLMGTPSPSHHIWNKVLMEKLASNGHNLTILSPNIEKPTPGMNYILMEDVYVKIYETFTDFDNAEELNSFQSIMSMYEFFNVASNAMLESNGVQQLLNYPKTFKFDVVVFDFTMQQSLLGFVDYFGSPPLISVSPFNIPAYTSVIAHTPIYTTFMPHFSASFGTKMNLYERFQNTLYWAFDLFYRKYYYMHYENIRAKKIFGPDMKDLGETEKMTDLVLVNCDFSMDFYQPLPPNVIPVGGLQVKRVEPMKPAVKEFVERAQKGVILLSFGSNIKSDAISDEKNQMIMDVFQSMPEFNFIWKNTSPKFKNIPHNVLIVDWIQQNSVLAHRKTKLFITHGGLLSVQEATWYGVPMIGVPFFVDQHQNVDKIKAAGVAEKLPTDDISIQNLSNLITKLLGGSYQSKMKARSQIFKNQPEHPLERASFWIEKLIENNGLDYLKSPAIDMKFYEIYMLDMLGILLLLVGAAVFGIKIIVKSIMYGSAKNKQD